MSQTDIANILWFVAVELLGVGSILFIKKKFPQNYPGGIVSIVFVMVIAVFYLVWCLVR
jgi:hypothetical protein